MSRRHPAISIEEDPAFQMREWRLKRVAWVVFALAIIAALAGLFSRGPLSETHAATADGTLAVDYARFERDGASSMLTADIAARDGRAVLSVDRAFAEAFTINSVQPEPSEAASADGGVRYTFLTASPRAVVRLSLNPNAAGIVASRIGSDTAELTIRQYIYP
jgi:hypothetical protein